MQFYFYYPYFCTYYEISFLNSWIHCCESRLNILKNKYILHLTAQQELEFEMKYKSFA